MDINALFYHHQVALMNAAVARDAEVARIHTARAGHYARLVREWREELRLPPYVWRDGDGDGAGGGGRVDPPR